MVFNNVFQYIHIDLVVIYISCIYFVLLGKKNIYCSICAFGTRLDIYGQITFIFKYTVNIIMEIYIYIYILQSIYNLIYSLKSYMAISSKHTNELPTTKAPTPYYYCISLFVSLFKRPRKNQASVSRPYIPNPSYGFNHQTSTE